MAEDNKKAHMWVRASSLGILALGKQRVCENCGMVAKHKDQPETACKGKVKVVLREKKP